MAVKAHCINHARTWRVVTLGISFFVALVILIIVGASGPKATNRVDFSVDVNAGSSAGGRPVYTWSKRLTDLSSWNQAMWLVMRMKPPVLPNNAGSTTFQFTQEYDVSIVADGVVLAKNTSHATQVVCELPRAPAEPPPCTGVYIFSQSHLYYSSYEVTVRLYDPLAAFTPVGISANSTIGGNFTLGYLQESYTNFEIGWKMFFVVISCIAWVVFVLRVYLLGAGVRDEQGNRLKTTVPQQWLVGLGFLLIFYNDPTFVAYLLKPSLVTSGFYAFCSVTFIAALLLSWLALFDLARKQGEKGLTWTIETASAAEQPGACFWVPKVLLLAVFWCITLAGYVYTRLQQLDDASFSTVETLGPFTQWIVTFVAALGGIYVLWIFGLLVLSFRTFRTMAVSNRFLVLFSIIALLVLLAGLFSNYFVRAVDTSALFLLTTGVPNIYIYVLYISFLPVKPKDGASGSAGGAGAGAGAGAGGAQELDVEAGSAKGVQEEDVEPQFTGSNEGRGNSSSTDKRRERVDRVRAAIAASAGTASFDTAQEAEPAPEAEEGDEHIEAERSQRS